MSRTNGCSGDCCVKFPLNGLSHKKFLKLSLEPGNFDSAEYFKIISMVVLVSEENEVAHYSCNHFDPINKLCTNYSDRPLMCSAYPYDGLCKHCWLTAHQLEGRILL